MFPDVSNPKVVSRRCLPVRTVGPCHFSQWVTARPSIVTGAADVVVMTTFAPFMPFLAIVVSRPVAAAPLVPTVLITLPFTETVKVPEGTHTGTI